MQYNGPKYYKDGQVAVVYSPDFGAGWYSWNENYPELLFHPGIVELVLNNKNDELTEYKISEIIGRPFNGYSNSRKLKVCWIDKGESFRIQEYDGSEKVIRIFVDDEIFVA